jgi:epoxyqueuosine reductase QueG
MYEQPTVNQTRSRLVSGCTDCVRVCSYCREGWKHDSKSKFQPEQQQQRQRK